MRFAMDKWGNNFNPAKISRLLLLRLLLLSQLLLASLLPVSPFSGCSAQISIPDKDIREIVSYFQTKDVSQIIIRFKNRMPEPVTDSKFRQAVYAKLPSVIHKLRFNAPQILEQLKKAILPVLSIYAREQVYDIILIQTTKPILFIDTATLLVISTGLIEQVKSDDELLGLIAHEVGHEYFLEYSFYTKQVLRAITEGSRELSLERKYSEALSLIELHCDAFASLTLSYIEHNPISFIDAIERFGRTYPNEPHGYHPQDTARRQLVGQIVPSRYLRIKPTVSPALQQLKNLLRSVNTQGHF